MLCAPVLTFTSSSSALLGCPRCGLSIWLSLLATLNTLFWVYGKSFFHEKIDKARKYSKSAIFVWYENGRRQLLGTQSIIKGEGEWEGFFNNVKCREKTGRQSLIFSHIDWRLTGHSFRLWLFIFHAQFISLSFYAFLPLKSVDRFLDFLQPQKVASQPGTQNKEPLSSRDQPEKTKTQHLTKWSSLRSIHMVFLAWEPEVFKEKSYEVRSGEERENRQEVRKSLVARDSWLILLRQ